MPRPTPTRRRALAASLAALAVPGLAGCARGVAVDAAPAATDPLCADVVLATPESLGEGLDRLPTDAQATTAWGGRTDPVVLRCGVEPLGPTAERCVAVETPGGPSVDWVVVEQDDGSWTFTTYGRVPAVEVLVPAAFAESRSTSFVPDLGPAVARAPAERSCL
ncbi:DUF3515 family protein [Cellulomonas endophytica]|uniref:DUF3515 family protein n=1 Tax=Cellulomonas endophytica TaxID=2494735 RepID=UPI001010BEC3|nr:DUF3515 family protein [Cellulomonas endophytica]